MLNKNIKLRITGQKNISEAFIFNLLLAFSGGFQDAYTYIVRNHVFANAQTGNVVLMSTSFMAGEWREGLSYLMPLLAFVSGVFIADNINYYFKSGKIMHWRQSVLILEMLLLFLVGFLPYSMNMTANILISFTCAMQVQSFRKVSGINYASTMCIGNIRSGTEALSSYLHHRCREDLKKIIYYFGIIGIFAIGAGVGGTLSSVFSVRTIWVSSMVLGICLLMLTIDIMSKKKTGIDIS